MALAHILESVEEVLKQKGLRFNVTVSEKDHQQVLTSLIDARWNVEVVAHPNLEQILAGVVKKSRLESLFPEPVRTLIYAAITHEGGHWQYCPYDINLCEEILHGTYQGLQSVFGNLRRDVNVNDLPLYIGTTAAFFCDVIDDTLNSIRDKNREEYVKGLGLRLLLLAEGNKPVLGISGKQHYTKLFTAYAELLARLTGMPQEVRERISKSYHPEMPEMEGVVRNALGIFLEDEGLAQKVYAGDLSKDVREPVASKLSDKWSWGRKAESFSGLIALYLLKEPAEALAEGLQASGNYLLSELGLLEPSAGLGKQAPTSLTELNTTQLMQLLQYGREAFLKAAVEVGKWWQDEAEEAEPPGDPELRRQILGIGIGKGHEVSYVSRFELLDMLYRQRAEEIILQILDQKKRHAGSIIAHLDRERVAGDFDLSLIDWHRTLLINRAGKSEVVLFRKDLPLEDKDPVDVMKGEIPDLAFIVDSSGSMAADLVNGNGPYDLLLRSIYSVFRWLERDGKGYQMRFSVINFSGMTYFSGWQPFSQLDKVKRALFRYQGGGTVLGTATIDRLVEERKDRFMAFLVTDSKIYNEDEVEEAILRLVGASNYFVQFQIEPPHDEWGGRLSGDSLHKRLAANGLDVHVLSDPRDLIGLCVKYAERVYGALR